MTSELIMETPPSSGGERAGRRHPAQSAAQVFARDTRLSSEAPLVFLAPGQADRLRGDARAGHFVCPLADCQDNRFIVYGGTERRHHFKHRSGAGHHAPESIAHHTAKHLIARWLRQLYPDAQVFPDTQEVETGQRPDVLLVFEDGTQVAYEVQFASLTADQWQSRRDRYATLGIKNVWLFGGKHYDRDAASRDGTGGQFQLHPVFRAVLAAVHPMLLIDPFAETVALGTGPDVDELLMAAGVEPPDLWSPLARAHERRPLMDMPATKGVIDIPGLREQIQRARSGHLQWLDRLRREAEQMERAKAEHQRRLAAHEEAERRERLRQEQLERQRAASAAASARANEARLQRVDRLSDELQQRKDRWRPEREYIEHAVGVLPEVVDAPAAEAETAITTAAPDEWRWAVLEALAANHGFAVDPRGLTDLVPLQAAARRPDAERLVMAYLVQLRAAGWVWFWGAPGPRPGEAVLVLAGPGQAPRARGDDALRAVGLRVAGPGPAGLKYLQDGNPTMRNVDNARRVGASTFAEVWAEAHAQRETEAIRASLITTGPGHSGPVDASGISVPDLIAVHRALPDARQWCDARAWPTWKSLPPHLHEAAQLTVYVLTTVHDGRAQPGIRLGNCTKDDEHQIVEALRASGYLTKGSAGWQPTFGGRL
ncbi:competence protein CoiA family protein [Cellulomonas cellasea]|uniref:competence protein CoiA family protein n=1 Tax=Cellulomonas cellasea TaxID=43670 RepID=UPI0025A428E5|nr:competence protein CoiA family protein [Cellulomonas cellasea]MDM8083777.1 competence protein CoiA family protein [Cellulomonas cellasea]